MSLTADDEKKLLQLLEKASKLGNVEVVIRFQDGYAVAAEVKEKIKLR